jgi:holliday junction DNA helicase RuvA
LAVLSGIEPEELVRAVEGADVARLTAIPGVGRKTSERMVLELKDRLPKRALPAGAAATPPLRLRDEVLSALINLGYHRPLAERAVDAALKAAGAAGGGNPGAGFERVLKHALRELAK